MCIRDRYPDRLAHRRREVSHAGIHRDHQVHQIDQRGGIAEVVQSVAEKRESADASRQFSVRFPDFLLQTKPVGGVIDQGQQHFQVDRTVMVIPVCACLLYTSRCV